MSVRNRVSAYARRFVEGMFVFDVAPIPVEETEAITTREELARCGRPWCYLTNAFVARAGSNSRLRVFEPEGMDAAGFPVLARRRRESRGTRCVQARGIAALAEAPPAGTPVRGTGLPLEYRILPESDLNGAGLLYFARYLAIANYGVRLFLSEQQTRPVSSPLIECLSTERLRICYFQNADAFDSVRIFVTAWLDPEAPAPAPSSGSRVAARFSFDVDLYRASDGVLMASCRLARSLRVPDREKALVYEAERLCRGCAAGAESAAGASLARSAAQFLQRLLDEAPSRHTDAGLVRLDDDRVGGEHVLPAHAPAQAHGVGEARPVEAPARARSLK